MIIHTSKKRYIFNEFNNRNYFDPNFSQIRYTPVMYLNLRSPLFSRKNERADRRTHAQLSPVFSSSRRLPKQPRHHSRGSGMAKKTTNFGEKCQTPLAHSHLFWVHLDESISDKSRKCRKGKWIRIFMTFCKGLTWPNLT